MPLISRPGSTGPVVRRGRRSGAVRPRRRGCRAASRRAPARGRRGRAPRAAAASPCASVAARDVRAGSGPRRDSCRSPQCRLRAVQASPSGLATATTYPSGSRTQISRWPGPLPSPSGGLRWGSFTTSAPSRPARSTTPSKSVTSPNQTSTPLPRAQVRVADRAVVVVGALVVELQHQLAVGEEPLVRRSAVVAGEAEQLLVPAAGRLDVA